MRLPNLLDHETLEEAIQQSDAFNSLLKLHCHPDTKVFSFLIKIYFLKFLFDFLIKNYLKF